MLCIFVLDKIVLVRSITFSIPIPETNEVNINIFSHIHEPLRASVMYQLIELAFLFSTKILYMLGYRRN